MAVKKRSNEPPRTAPDAARVLGVQERTLNRYIADGVLPPPDTVRRGTKLVNVYYDDYLRDAARTLAIRASDQKDVRVHGAAE